MSYRAGPISNAHTINTVPSQSPSNETTPLMSFAAAQEPLSSPSLRSTGKYVQVPSNGASNSSYQLSPTQSMVAIRVVLLTVVFQSIGFTLVLPSMYLYLQSVHGNSSFYGWVVAIYSVGSFLGAILFGWWYDRRPAKEAILVASAIALGGNILYCFIEFFPSQYGRWLMFFARFLVGFGSGCVAVCRAYISEATELKNKVAMMAAVSGAQGIGFVIGPGLGSVLSFLNFKFGYFDVNEYTAPGYLSAVLCIVCLVTVFGFMPSTKKRVVTTNATAYVANEAQLPIFAALFLFFAAVSVFSIFETDFTILSKADFGWGTSKNSLYFLVAAVISTIAYAVIATPRIKRLDERKSTIVGLLLLILGMLAFVVYEKPVHLEDRLTFAQLAVGGVLFAVGYPIASTYIFGLYSKILNPKVQGSKMGWITAAGSMARMLGPIWASNALTDFGDTVVFGGTALFLIVAVIVLCCCYTILVPHRDYGKDQSSSSSSSSV